MTASTAAATTAATTIAPATSVRRETGNGQHVSR